MEVIRGSTNSDAIIAVFKDCGGYREGDIKGIVKQAKSEAQNQSCSWSKQRSGQVVDSYGTASSRPGGGARDTHLIYRSGNGTITKACRQYQVIW